MKKLHKGFSLIEMMFVIVLISIITAIVIGALRGKLTDDTIQRAASDMELILQADQSYFSDNQKATTTMSDLETYLTLPLKDGNIYNPWGYTYNLLDPSSAPGKLQVSTTAPDSQTANKLAALLPGGICDNTDCANRIVIASIPVSIGKHMQETDIPIFWPAATDPSGQIGNGSLISVPAIACPNNYTAKVIASLPHWGGSRFTYFVSPHDLKGDSAPDYQAYPITNFVAQVGQDPVQQNNGNLSWYIYIWYVLSGSSQFDTNPNTDYQALQTFTNIAGGGITPKTTNTPYMSDRYYLADYEGVPQVGINQADKTEDPTNSWYGTTHCGDLLRKDGCGSGQHTMQNGYIGTLKVIQWCQKNSATINNASAP